MRASPPAVDNKKAVKLRVQDRGTGQQITLENYGNSRKC
jgi:hypothetical protein